MRTEDPPHPSRANAQTDTRADAGADGAGVGGGGGGDVAEACAAPMPRALDEALRAPRAASLSLARQRLAAVPPELVRLQHLTRLDLSGNELCSLVGLPDLRNLAELDLSSNRLRRLPIELLGQASLARVDMRDNLLDDVALAREAAGELLPACEFVF
ncbi:hypothetical protein KFE25_004611 [Diacronema lutheri]|uniref:Uncharacterized protein n=1 Tax=Diacronema lutheri TaxID=2081491 RepID=A0A8J6CAI6_DIALT|nr:hypothetical protein KFE25_004611 [Diacronema lutheri]